MINFHYTIKLKNQHGNIFYDKLSYVYLEMPNFRKTESQLHSRLDKWLYFIKYLEDFQSIPAIFADDVFLQAFQKAEVAKLGQTELDNYENSLKIYRDIKSVIDSAFDDGKMEGLLEGKLEGLLEGKLETARMMKNDGESIDKIKRYTGLSEEEINRI